VHPFGVCLLASVCDEFVSVSGIELLFKRVPGVIASYFGVGILSGLLLSMKVYTSV